MGSPCGGAQTLALVTCIVDRTSQSIGSGRATLNWTLMQLCLLDLPCWGLLLVTLGPTHVALILDDWIGATT
jgi:hypothetical protein